MKQCWIIKSLEVYTVLIKENPNKTEQYINRGSSQQRVMAWQLFFFIIFVSYICTCKSSHFDSVSNAALLLSEFPLKLRFFADFPYIINLTDRQL
jgi:hypothetical protein